MRKSGRWLASAFVAASLAHATPSRADCCSDSLTCIAAVATGGLSCAADAASAVSQVLNLVNQLRDYGRTRLETVLAYLTQQLNSRADAEHARVAGYRDTLSEAVAESTDSPWKQKFAAVGTMRAAPPALDTRARTAAQPVPSRDAANVAGSPAARRPVPETAARPGAVPAPTADPQQASQAIGAARTRITELNQKATALYPQHDLQVKGAVTQANALNADVRRQFDVAFTANLATMAATLTTALADPLSALATLPAVIAQVEAITRGLESLLGPIAERGMNQVNAHMSQANATADAIERYANHARGLSDAMRRLQLEPTQPNLARLQIALAESDPNRPLGKQAWASFRPAYPTALTPSACDTKLLVRDLSTFSATRISVLQPRLQKFQVRGRAPVSSYARLVSSEMDRYFTGRPPAEAQRTLQQLIQESRQAYARDPRTQAALERYLRDEAGARGVR